MQITKLKYLLTLLLLLPIRGCVSNNTGHNSVMEIDCTKSRSLITIPGTPGIQMSASRCKDYVFTKEKARRAITLFVSRYAYEFNMHELEVWELLRGLQIEVSAIPRAVANVYDVNGNLFKENVPVSGLAFSPNRIWVEVKTSQIWPTSLAHELVHIIIWRSQGVHADPDHEGSQFSGWTKKHTKFLKSLRQELMDLEI